MILGAVTMKKWIVATEQLLNALAFAMQQVSFLPEGSMHSTTALIVNLWLLHPAMLHLPNSRKHYIDFWRLCFQICLDSIALWASVSDEYW